MTVACILAAKGRAVATIQPHRTLVEAAAVLSEKGIGALVVRDAAHRVLGILSERDIIRAVAREGGVALTDAVSRHMTPDPVTVSESASIDSVMGNMTDGRFRHMPVVNDGALVGLVSIGDVVKYRMAEVVSEHLALREYIATA